MECVYGAPFRGAALERLKGFLGSCGIRYDEGVEFSVCLREGDALAASGSLDGNVLKCIAVSPARQNEGLTAPVVTELIKEAFRRGRSHLFLFTKPEHRERFQELGFYPISRTDEVLLMENKKDGIQAFVARLPRPPGDRIGAIVANCNPLTRGHLYLIETAAASCDVLHLFILSEDKSDFSAQARRDLAIRGTAHIPQVVVQPTGPYLISAATFPDYFLKDPAAAREANGSLDLKIFAEHFARPLGIRRRFVGDEPYSPLTAAYNRRMRTSLPAYGIEVVEIPRLEAGGGPISASRVRALFKAGDLEAIGTIVPPVTYRYLASLLSPS
ncbi:MAG: [citrate (pro-3S)-lyase] ligase [Spirochaetaceae bacterium]|jgi:[citrate (pro-3S)-lyase] ligase|nr:[citrate (pro-3S)-lyase] ligase [Spirochaetaceae bacterium]